MLRCIAVYTASLVIVLGVLMSLVPVVDIICGEKISVHFLVSAILCIGLGSVTLYIIRRYLTWSESVVGALVGYSVAWVSIVLIAAIPLSLEMNIPYVDAVFETTSGFTGTGLTVLVGLDYMRKSILFWRALMQWSGELGFAVFAMVVIPYFWRYGAILYNIERPTRIYASMQATARRLLSLYVFYTLVGILATYYAGANLFDALTHTMTAIATGGMSNYDENFMKVYSYAPLAVYPVTIIMFLGGASFVSLNDILEFRFRELWRNEEFKLYTILTLSLSLLVSGLYLFHGTPLTTSLTLGFFNTISAITTTGFSLGDMSSLPPSIKTLLIIGMFVGGMTFSTAGGLKVGRLLFILKKFKHYTAEILVSETVYLRVLVEGKPIEERVISNVLLFFVTHIGFVSMGAFLIKIFMPGVDYMDALFEATSAASCVGLSTGIVSSNAPFVVKLGLTILMLLGKLEYLPVIILTGIILHRKILKLIKA